MLTLHIPAHVGTLQIDDFPKDCERSVEGALHLRPGTLEVSDAEWAHLKKKHHQLALKLRVVSEVVPVAAAPAVVEVKAEEVAPALPEVAEEPARDETPHDKPSGKRSK